MIGSFWRKQIDVEHPLHFCRSCPRALPAAAADLSLGTWERNVKKSKSSGPDRWKRQTVVREAAPGGAKIAVTAEMKNGQKLQLSWTARYDGSPVLVEGAPAGWDTDH